MGYGSGWKPFRKSQSFGIGRSSGDFGYRWRSFICPLYTHFLSRKNPLTLQPTLHFPWESGRKWLKGLLSKPFRKVQPDTKLIGGDGALGEQAGCLLSQSSALQCVGISPACYTKKARIPVFTGLPTIRPGADETGAGPGATTRRVVAPKAGLVGHGSGASDRSVDAEGNLSG